jgi:signal transduction histidine kinase
MKRLWIQLSFAFSMVLILSQLVSYLTLVGLAYSRPNVFVQNINFRPLTYQEFIRMWARDQLFSGAAPEEIAQQFYEESDKVDIAGLVEQVEAQLATNENDQPGFTSAVVGADNAGKSVVVMAERVTPPAGIAMAGGGESIHIASSEADPVPLNLPLALFFNSSTIRVVIQSIVIGVIAGVLTSRYLTKPLGQLIEAVQAFGKRDMSQRVQVKGSQEIEELLQTFNNMADELENAERLRSNIFADVSHELRTPLTGLEGSLRASLDHVYEIDEGHIANMVVQTQHLIHLVEDLRLLAQAEARKLPLKPEPVEVNQLVQDTVETFAVQAEESGITIDATLPTPPLTIQADAHRLRQVLHNLVSNALRHTGENGRIQITAAPDKNQVSFSVQDNGEGMAAEHLLHVFDRFYRADKARSRDTGGAGLGLAITKALVEAHNGRIEVMSDGIGRGSTFRFSIPQHPV